VIDTDFTYSPVPVDPVTLLDVIPAASGLLLALDFDGTLAPIVQHPPDAALLPKAKVALTSLAPRVPTAIISGRTLAELVHHFAGIDGLHLIGEHGRVWQQPNGTVTTAQNTTAHTQKIASVVEQLQHLLATQPGWRIERKPAGVAVHHRNVTASDMAEMRTMVLKLFADASHPQAPFRVLQGHKVDELVPDGVSKGTALATLCATLPDLTPVALGDDVTDEDAFRVARQCGGMGILVSATSHSSDASHRLAEPADVATFLTLLAARSS